MSFARAYRKFWLPGLADVRAPSSQNFQSLFVSKSSTVNRYVSPNDYSIYIPKSAELTALAAFEASRFASVCFESVQSEKSNEKFNGAVGWPIIRTYYAAFFAAHALLRIQGIALTRIAREAFKNILPAAMSIYGGSLNGGLCKLSISNGTTVDILVPEQSSEGSHIFLWKVFEEVLEECGKDLLINSEDVENDLIAADLIERLILGVKFRGGLAWLSKVRNDVNYSHIRGAWYPYQNSTINRKTFDSKLSKWRCDPHLLNFKKENDDLHDFCGICTLVISMAYSVLSDLAKRSKFKSAPARSKVSQFLDFCE